MNALQLFWILICFLFGSLVAKYAYNYYGIIGFIIGFLIGGTGNYYLFVAIGKVAQVIHLKQMRKCPCGICKPDEYVWKGEYRGFPIKKWHCGLRTILKDNTVCVVEEDKLDNSS